MRRASPRSVAGEAESLPRRARAEPFWLRGTESLERRELQTAVRLLTKAIRIDPKFGEAHSNLGNALVATGNVKKSLLHHDKAIQLLPRSGRAHYNYAIALLLLGRWSKGFAEYEWRHEGDEYAARSRQVLLPRWTDEALEGRSIFLAAEQGAGDTLQFARYAPLLSRRGARVILESPPELRSLLETLPGPVELAAPNEFGGADLWAPLLSLPGLVGTTPETVPSETPYLRADPERIARWRPRLGLDSDRLNIGLVWQGNPAQRFEPHRSIPLRLLAPLFQRADCRFYLLQKEHGREQIAGLQSAQPLIDLGPELGDFSDTAAVISQLDLTISTCTSVAHLAGALGRPLWVLLQAIPDWRWLLTGSSTPWYPSARLFRQATPGDWQSVADELAQALAQMAGAR